MASASPARVLRRSLAIGLVAAGAALLPTSPIALADPALPTDATQAQQQLVEISHEAEALNERVLVAQEDLDAKRGAEQAAREQVSASEADLVQARATQQEFQGTVDSLAAASYQGARVSSLSALMLSKSPQDLLDQMSALDVLAEDTTSRVAAYSEATAAATTAEQEAAAAAAAATEAATAAQQVQADLTTKQADLDQRAGEVRTQLAALTAEERESYLGTPVPAGFSAPAGSPAAAQEAESRTVTAASAPAAAAAPAPAPAYSAPSGSGAGYAALQNALSKVGSPYVYGANGPSTFDCSGLVQWSYGQAGVSLPRTTGGQAGVGTAVSQSDLQPGDIVIFYGGGHDGIYAGNGMVVHAPTSGDVVKVAPMQYMPFSGARRV